MMADILLSPALWWVLFAGAVCFAVGAAFGKKRPGLWALMAGVCTVAAVLDALLLGRTLAEALNPVLAVVAVSLAGLTRKKGGGET